MDTAWTVYTTDGQFTVDALHAAQPWPTIRQGETSTFTCWFEEDDVATAGLHVNSGDTHTIPSGASESWAEATVEADGTLTQQSGSTLTIVGSTTQADRYPNFQGLKPYLDFADAAAYGLDVNNRPWYHEQLPATASVDSLVLGFEPNTELREQTVDGVWGLVTHGEDERNLPLSNWWLTIDVFVLGRFEAFSDRTAVEDKLQE